MFRGRESVSLAKLLRLCLYMIMLNLELHDINYLL